MCLTEEDPIEDAETLLRRVPNNEHYLIENSQENLIFHRQAFGPIDNDSTGISLFRRLFVNAAAVAGARKNVTGYFVVGLIAADIRSRGLNPIPDPQSDELPGHSLIPEINRLDYNRSKDDKERIKGLQQKLADLVNDHIGNSVEFNPTA